MTHRLETKAVHGGEERHRAYDALIPPIVMSSTYTFRGSDEVQHFVADKAAGGPAPRYEYARYGSPTQAVAERKLAELDGGERALLFSSGMAAIATLLLSLLSVGDHVVGVGDLYRKTRSLISTSLPRWGIDATLVSPASLEPAIRPATRVVFLEIPTNPHLRVTDLEAVTTLAARRDLLTVVDATFATPVNLRPLEVGADLVVHSATKYIAGHNDVVCGAVVGSSSLIADIEEARGVLGSVAGALDAYLVARGAKTLPLRVRRQNESAQVLAEFLESHPAVSRVYYPGLTSHPDHAIASRLLSGFGGVVSFELSGGLEAASRCVDRLEIPPIGPTFGGIESIVQQQALFISHDPAERAKYGISDALVRYAVGLEAVDDLIEDLRCALDGLPTEGGSR